MGSFDTSAVQSLVVRPHVHPWSRHMFFRFETRDGARSFLAECLPDVSHGATDLPGIGHHLNVAVTWTGLRKLGTFDAPGALASAEDDFPADFRVPPEAATVAAYGPSSPEKWWNRRFSTTDVDLTLHLYAADRQKLECVSTAVRTRASLAGLQELVPTRDGEAVTGEARGTGIDGLRRLHFGYSDGFSQPEVDWSDTGTGGYPRRHFVIDGWDEDAQSFPRRDPWRGFVLHSSYMAVAWVYQDVAAFNLFLRDNAGKVARPGMSQEEAEELLAAKLLGRWRDGTPLALSPDRPDVSLASDDFRYGDDPAGLRCPVASHVRIVNGRDQALDFTNRVMFPAGFPRVVRRGASYGSWVEGVEDDGQDRGILGLFVCANVKQQFFSLMRWIGTTNFSDAYTDPHGQDPLFASRDVPGASNTFVIPTVAGNVTLAGLPRFIRLQGLIVTLLPSMDLLRRLAST